MALNYDPKLNRLKEFRFKDEEYEQLLLERPEDILSAQEFGDLVRRTTLALRRQQALIATSLIAQFALGRLPWFKALNGYLRTTIRTGICVGPFASMRWCDNKELNAHYSNLLKAKLQAKYQNPISTPK